MWFDLQKYVFCKRWQSRRKILSDVFGQLAGVCGQLAEDFGHRLALIQKLSYPMAEPKVGEQ